MKEIGSNYSDTPLSKRLKKLEQLSKENKKHEDTKLQNTVVQLPFWPEPVRGIPNSVLRGSLFAAIQGRYAQYLNREILIDNQNLKIVFTGKQLCQSDMDVYEYALHLARHYKLGSKIEFSAHGFLKAIGKSTGKWQHGWFKTVMAKLTACCVEITHEKITYAGSLIDEFYRDEKTGRYAIKINSKLALLYDSGYTYIQWDSRKKIGNKPLARWLHGFISTHVNIYPTKLENYYKMSGSKSKELKVFKQNLKNALKELKIAEFIVDFEIDDKNLVHIQRIGSKSQQKHIK